MLNVDGFKQVNDEHGHAAGDRILRAIAGIMRRVGRGASCVSRVGGDEFLIAVLADHVQAAGLAEFIRNEVRTEEFLSEVGPIHVTVSIGVATSEGGFSGQELIREADSAMYSAKVGGLREQNPDPH